ncbi:hypothetical protein [Salinigranum salinum]|uniref:hypothetical protein n=1 Tax=Salinigranum salinum TaxID=1364937 RepID=UPI0012611D5B|nr:hypothetical protein [Salinigranum salinum]
MAGETRATGEAVELRVRLYELLHRKLERERTARMTRATRGGLLVAVVFGFAIVSGDLRFIALTPLLYGVVAMDGLKSTVKILYLNHHLVRVESGLGEEEPLYDWASRHGVFGDIPRIEVADFDLNEIPTIALVVSVAAGYVGLVVLAVRTWNTTPDGAPGLAPPVSVDVLLVGYATLTVVLLVISGVGYLHLQRLSRDVARGRTS